MESTIKVYDLEKIASNTGVSTKRVKPNEIRFSNPNNQAPRIAINQVLTTQLINKGHTRLKFARNEITGEFYFLFGTSGYEMRISKRVNNRVNFEIGVHAIWKLFSDLNGIKDDQCGAVFVGNNLSKQEDNSTYAVEKVQIFSRARKRTAVTINNH